MLVTRDTAELRISRVPISPTPFIGRERELAAAQVLLRNRDVRLLTITGPGGVGKTRLAGEVAHSLAGEFPDGAHFVSLAGVSEPGSVAPAIARSLGIRETGDRPTAATLLADLPHRTALVVLDNFEQVDAAAPFLGELLAAGSELKLVVTSRSVLRLTGEHHLPLSPLAFPDPKNPPPITELVGMPAVRLFAERAQAATGNFTVTATNAADVVTICARLDGLPLALQLAAARLRHLPLPAIADRLARSLALLVGGPRDSPIRHQTLRAAIDWSYGLLGPSEQAFFHRLAIFVGGWTLDGAESVTGSRDELEIVTLDGLSALIDDHLVTQSSGWDGDPRFTMLETIREFGFEKLQNSGDLGRTEQRHRSYFLAMASQAWEMIYGPDQLRWMARLTVEHDNVRVAIERAIERGDAETALSLGVSLWGFWTQRGHLTEGRHTLERGLRIRAHIDPVVRARAIYCLGTLALDLSDHAEARSRFSESLAIWRQLGDQDNVAAALNGLGLVAKYMGEYRQATKYLDEALSIWTDLDDPSGIAIVQAGLGDLAAAVGAYERARVYHQRALDVRRQLRNTDGVAYSLWDLGTVARMSGDIGMARTLFEESQAIFKELGNRQGEALVWQGLARLAMAGGTDLEALRLFGDALASLQAIVDRVDCIEGIAAVVARRGHAESAVRLLSAGNSLRVSAGSVPTAVELQEQQQTLTIARRTLANSAFDEAWAAGQKLTLEEAVAEALTLTESTEVLPRPASPFNLTRREQEVLALLCQHLTDAQIAERLYLSPRTASNHVANILAKLGAANRREAITLATRHGLV